MAETSCTLGDAQDRRYHVGNTFLESISLLRAALRVKGGLSSC